MSIIVNYQPSYYDQLLRFYKKYWKEKHNEDYLNYRLFKVSNNPLDIEKNLLAINDNGDIVGCNLFLPAKATIYGEEHTIFWSNDVFVEKNYRSDVALELIFKANATKNLFGSGGSSIAKKIQKKLKTNFIAETTAYFIINRWMVKALLYKLGIIFPEKTDLKTIPDNIRVKDDVFEFVRNADDLSILDDGYWNKGKLDIEMNRGIDFLKHRFFDNFNSYYFYQKKNEYKKSYFVFRKIIKRGIAAIALVDFRFDLDDFGEYLKILRAVHKVAVKNRIPLVVTLSTIIDKKIRFAPLVIRSHMKRDVVTNIKNIKPSILVTFADSDGDLAIGRITT